MMQSWLGGADWPDISLTSVHLTLYHPFHSWVLGTTVLVINPIFRCCCCLLVNSIRNPPTYVRMIGSLSEKTQTLQERQLRSK